MSSKLDRKLIKDLAELLGETDLNEIEYKSGDVHVRVVRHQHHLASPSLVHHLPHIAEPVASQPQSFAGAVSSPMVGVAYLRPEPAASPFVKEGDQVKEGQTICLVEAMKTFNPVTAPRSGRVTKILIDDGSPVEFGQPLMVIE